METPEELQLWDEIVESSSYGTVYHLARFQDLVAQAFSLETHMMGIYGDQKLLGVIPMHFHKENIPRYIWSPYDKIRYGGPVLAQGLEKDTGIIRDVLMQAVKFTGRLGAECVTIAPPIGTEYGEIFRDCGFTRINMYTPIIDLKKGEDYLWGGMTRKCRNAVRKAQKSGVTVDLVSDRTWVDTYWRMLLDTYAKKPISPVFPKDFYRNLSETFGPERMRVYLAKLDGKAIAGSIFLVHGDCVYYQDNASFTAFQGCSPNNLIQWEFIKWARMQGFERYDLIGGMLPSITHFKLGFGAKLVHHERWYMNLNPRIAGRAK